MKFSSFHPQAGWRNALAPAFVLLFAVGRGPAQEQAANSVYPVYTVTNPPAAYAPAANPAPPPSAPAQCSEADLEKLVAPIALYPDPLIAVILPAAAYPTEVVLAARFVEDANNLAQIDAQPWDDSVKAVARFPAVIKMMDADLAWTISLGKAFLEQEKPVMDAIQAMRVKAQAAGTLRTTPQQVVIVTNAVVERAYEQQVVYVTNTVVEIQPASPQVIYVPTYNPTVVYAPPPTYVDPLAPLVTFGMGVAVGAIIANNCDWHYGGIYMGGHGFVVWGGGGHPPYYPPPPGYRPPAYYPPPGYRPPAPGYRPPGYPPPGYRPPATPYQSSQRWQPDQNRLSTAGAPGAATREARGWGSSAGSFGDRPATARPSTGNVAAGTRPSPGNTTPAARPSTTPAAPRAPTPTTRPSTGGGGSAFGGMSSGASTHDFSNRGATSRGSRVSGGGGRMGGGGRAR